ncbi:MAG: UDP-N-acetylmuramoyl-tripeptide--D-alanyl-D-alanine ligase [Emergencia sp.]|jgi:UDP-N-acetylmuramoyl-tripeptide--D-alanyl-D-alanine ligase|uniref:UDP-N-acetylmuramoyl-tripeptide--D-alanyl-D- alanine ligase n=1 Tax=Emergencia sp. JLR.KK010 TaxID=3114296 RepID=UPI0021722E19|nr:UDP-N-acetylmuramoyl-tripeptide--D-alanyl-D-alanine ligase [Emergencia sp.]
MNTITLGEIEKATDGKIISGQSKEEIFAVCTDSRTAKAGDLFVPIVGEVHDAHKFIPQVKEKGCTAVLTAREDAVPEGISAVLVSDTTKALQRLAAWYLERLQLKTVAVTGSVGKTSTRDMVHAILKQKYCTGATVGNFNNDIGVPLTIFSFDDTMEAAVLEIGMDHFGEIHRLVDIIRPDIGIITNVGISHIENLGSREGIFSAKMEITDYFGKENTLVVNSSCDMLQKAEFRGDYDVIKVSLEEDQGDYTVKDIEDFGTEGIAFTLAAEGQTYRISLQVPGAHNALNASLAVAACRKLGVSIEEAARGLVAMELTGKRLSIREAGGIKVIDDTYNAAPDSMKSALNTLVSAKGNRKIAILGGMNELGENSAVYHQEIGAYAAEKNIDLLIAVGEKAGDIALGANHAGMDTKVYFYNTKNQFYEEAMGLFKPGDTVLVKGSRAMGMEEIVDKILKEQE